MRVPGMRVRVRMRMSLWWGRVRVARRVLLRRGRSGAGVGSHVRHDSSLSLSRDTLRWPWLARLGKRMAVLRMQRWTKGGG